MSKVAPIPSPEQLQAELSRLKEAYHRNCMFAKSPPVNDLSFAFNKKGALVGIVTFGISHQSYDRRVHGGLIAAIVDAGMTQCLMGYSIIAYTVDLSIRYHQPVELNRETVFVIRITENKRDRIFRLECAIKQDGVIRAEASSRFFGQREPLI